MGMPSGTLLIPPMVALGIAIAFVVVVLVLWLVMRSKAKRQQAEAAATLTQLRAESAAALQAEQTRALNEAAQGKQAADAVAAKLADTEQRFMTHREVSERRSNDASQQIARLESELATTREVAAQLVPTQSRIKDLELALSAEQGRVKAQEQAIEATNAHAADFEKRLAEAQEVVIKRKTEMLEVENELRKVRAEQAAYAAAGGPEAELAKAREANQQAETKIANLQRALKAAEARIEMVQKEFMNAVGVATAPVPGIPTAAPSNDKKLRDLEEKLSHLEAESRKRAREDGYKIAELEYRLSEALESAKAGQSASEPPKAEPAPPPPAAPPPQEPVVAEFPKVEPVIEATAAVEAPAAELPKVEIPASDPAPVVVAEPVVTEPAAPAPVAVPQPAPVQMELPAPAPSPAE